MSFESSKKYQYTKKYIISSPMQNNKFENRVFEGKSGKILLELSKTYKGDSRFKLDRRFEDDIDVDKLPEKFKQISESEILQKGKKKKIKKDKPLIVQRFEPGSLQGQKNVKKAEGIKKFEEGLKRHEQKKKKQKVVEKGIDRVKKAERILSQPKPEGPEGKASQFKIMVKGNRQEAFQANDFKLFG